MIGCHTMKTIKLLYLSLAIVLLCCAAFCDIVYFILRLAGLMLTGFAPAPSTIPAVSSTGAFILAGVLGIALPMLAGVLLEIRSNVVARAARPAA